MNDNKSRDEKIKSLTSQYKTPFYLYERQKIEDNYHALENAVFPGARLFYSMKANPLLGVCQVLKELGAGIEAASMGELFTALKAGFLPENIIFTSPGKNEEEIRFALSKGIRLINIESLREAQIIDSEAAKLSVKARIGIRINPSVCYSNAKIKMSGVSSQFGIEEEDITEEFADSLAALKNIEVEGFQVYMGTQMLLAEDIINNTEYAIKMALSLAKKLKIRLSYLNAGGGFGVRYFKNETPLSLEQLREGMQRLHDTYAESLKDTELIFESGRYVMAESGEFVTKVLYVKESKGQKYVICDGGSSFHSSAAFLGRFVRNNFPMRTIPEGEETVTANVCGPLCTPLDVIGQKVNINKDISPDDYVVIELSGAYGYTYSPSRFLSHVTPAELMLCADGVRELRRRGDIDSCIMDQNGI